MAQHWQFVVQLVADMVLLTVPLICTSLCQVHHSQECHVCHVMVATKHMDKIMVIMVCSQEVAAHQV